MNSDEEFEEERRLLYVACTRARDYLGLFVPSALYNRYYQSNDPAMPSPFLQDIPAHLFSEFRESYAGGTVAVGAGVHPTPSAPKAGASGSVRAPQTCRHKIFGQGRIVERIEPDKYKINFPGFGLKVIMQDYVELVDG
jgi:DNA helicase-2/ATP-dependent DNA helicase PcrA